MRAPFVPALALAVFAAAPAAPGADDTYDGKTVKEWVRALRSPKTREQADAAT